jgi:hypothetical protein
MARPMTAVQLAFIDWCIAYFKFQIVGEMSTGFVSHDVDSYDALVVDAGLDKYGYCDEDMVAAGRRIFPDAPGQPGGSAFDVAYDVVCTAMDEWLRGPVIPIEQISFPDS